MALAKHILLGSALSLAACAADVNGAQDDVELTGSAAALRSAEVSIDVRRSLAVTEEPILQGFTFERVMNQLVGQARVSGLTAAGLFQQWWDTQNAGPGLNASAPHCTGELNGFPYDCREAPAEGAQATCNPFTDAACKYIPIGLFNRFDTAAEDGSDCGQYRVVFAKETGVADGRDRNLFIFEAALSNPEPRKGLAGCRRIVDFWANLSRVDDMAERAKQLEQFYFRGLGYGVGPVIDIANFGDNALGRGQVRTNQFMGQTSPRVWTLREFKLMKSCEPKRSCREPAKCTLQFVPATDKVNPWGGLFADGSDERNQSFQANFVATMDGLTGDSLLDLTLDAPERFNSGQSHSSGSVDTNYLAQFVDGGEFSSAIEAELDEQGAELEPVEVVARAQTQTCAGCHQLSNNDDLGGGLVWPASLGFVHISERDPETVDGVRRFRISPALTDVFLPHRKEVMETFLKSRPARGHGHHRHHRGFSH